MTAVQADEDDRELERLLHAVPSVRYLPAKTPQALLAIIAGSSYVVSGRLHGLVLAARAGVNYAGLIYDPKVNAFLEETGAPAFGLPIDEEKLVLTVLHKERQDDEKVAALRARAQAGAEWLNAQLQ
jgi:polysaccharide pyruvyl transferase WcaK-like protein